MNAMLIPISPDKKNGKHCKYEHPQSVLGKDIRLMMFQPRIPSLSPFCLCLQINTSITTPISSSLFSLPPSPSQQAPLQVFKSSNPQILKSSLSFTCLLFPYFLRGMVPIITPTPLEEYRTTMFLPLRQIALYDTIRWEAKRSTRRIFIFEWACCVPTLAGAVSRVVSFFSFGSHLNILLHERKSYWLSSLASCYLASCYLASCYFNIHTSIHTEVPIFQAPA